MRRFFISSSLTDEMVITGDDVHHISKVLRMKTGDKCIVVAPDGTTGLAAISDIMSKQINLSLINIIDDNKEPAVRVILVQGLPKSDKMDYIVQKAVELGVHQIIPMIAERSVVQYNAQKKIARVERWQKIAAEASKQCRRSKIPEVTGIQTLRDILPQFDDKTELILLYEGKTSVRLHDVLIASRSDTIAIIVGPEGGFSEEEVALAAAHNAAIVTMGPRILRTETAAVASMAVIMYACGDLGG